MQPGERIRQFRKDKKLTQKDLHEMTGFSQGFISEIERGVKNPSREFLKKLNEVYNISSDYVLYGNSSKDNLVPIVSDVKPGYKNAISPSEKRLPKKAHQRRIVDKVIKILESGNQKAVRALKSNIDAFFDMVEIKNPKFEGGD